MNFEIGEIIIEKSSYIWDDVKPKTKQPTDQNIDQAQTGEQNNETQITLKDISMNVLPKTINAIIGKIGSGKSS